MTDVERAISEAEHTIELLEAAGLSTDFVDGYILALKDIQHGVVALEGFTLDDRH